MNRTQYDPRCHPIEPIFHQHKDMVYSIALSAVQNTRDAEDITLYTFREARNIPSTDPSGQHIASRLLEIVTGECLRTARNRSNSPVGAQNNFFGNEHDDFMLPIEYARHSELKGRLMQVINGLPVHQRMALVMYVYNRLTLRATATAMRCSENTALAHLCGAKASVKQQLEEIAYRNGEYFNSTEMVPFNQVYSGLIAGQAMSSQTASYLLDALRHTVDRCEQPPAPPVNAVAPPKGLSTGSKVALWISSVATVLVLVTVCAVIGFSPKASSKPSSSSAKETVVVVETQPAPQSSSQAPPAPREPEAPRNHFYIFPGAREKEDDDSSKSESENSSSKSDPPLSSSSSSTPSSKEEKDEPLDEAAILKVMAGSYNEQKSTATDNFVNMTIQTDKTISFFSLNYQTKDNPGYRYAKITSIHTKSKGIYTFAASNGDAPLSGMTFTYYSAGTPTAALPFSSPYYETSGGALTKPVIIDNRNTVYK